MWMPLIDLTSDMGIMQFASGSQKMGYITSTAISDASEDFFKKYVEEKGFKLEGPPAARAGDATFHSGWTLHSAPSNKSNRMREVMTIIYFADKTRVLKPDHDNRRLDHEVWLRSIPPGEFAASDLNPVIG